MGRVTPITQLARQGVFSWRQSQGSKCVFQVSFLILLVPLANASHMGKLQVCMGGNCPRLCIQGDVNKLGTILQQCVLDSFLVP